MNSRFGFFPYQLTFHKPILTSRGGMTHKNGWFIWKQNENDGSKQIISECSIIEGLSIDEEEEVIKELDILCSLLSKQSDLIPFRSPAVKFAAECALRHLNYGPTLSKENEFNSGEKGIPINGLIWMGTAEEMYRQTRERVAAGYKCIKLKIGALPFETELNLIRKLMDEFGNLQLSWRLDANGAFEPENALKILDQLAEFRFHSIEQPIRQGQWKEMKKICDSSPIPVALDEELIGRFTIEEKYNMISEICPSYLILKPGIMGGFGECEEWIKIAGEKNISWWATSALESNIGLNAIAQWTYLELPETIHGLGTGSLYINNIESPLHIQSGKLFYNPNQKWKDDIA